MGFFRSALQAAGDKLKSSSVASRPRLSSGTSVGAMRSSSSHRPSSLWSSGATTTSQREATSAPTARRRTWEKGTCELYDLASYIAQSIAHGKALDLADYKMGQQVEDE